MIVIIASGSFAQQQITITSSKSNIYCNNSGCGEIGVANSSLWLTLEVFPD